MTGRQPRDILLDVLAVPLATRGLDLEDVRVSSAGRRRVVQVLVDKDGGVSLVDIAEASRQVSALLDDNDVLGDTPYTLEVTSPGVDRPLTQPRHWRRHVGRLAKVTPHDGATVTGRIHDADDTGVVLLLDQTVTRIAFGDIAAARIEIEFNPPGPRGTQGGAESVPDDEQIARPDRDDHSADAGPDDDDERE